MRKYFLNKNYISPGKKNMKKRHLQELSFGDGIPLLMAQYYQPKFSSKSEFWNLHCAPQNEKISGFFQFFLNNSKITYQIKNIFIR